MNTMVIKRLHSDIFCANRLIGWTLPFAPEFTVSRFVHTDVSEPPGARLPQGKIGSLCGKPAAPVQPTPAAALPSSDPSSLLLKRRAREQRAVGTEAESGDRVRVAF